VSPTPQPRPPVPPDDALADLLPPDVVLGRGRPLGVRHPAAVPVWYGVVWSRLGDASRAWTHFDRVRLPALQPWIAAERGRVLRELGLHADAEALEWQALLRADDAVDAAMLRISLVADAVGAGDLERAQRRLAAARDAVADLADGPRAARQRLRLAWVGVEVAALAGGPLPTAGLPWWDEVAGRPVQPPDAAAGTRFHRAKGLLFAGVATGDHRLLAAAAAQAPPVLAWAVHLARHDLAGEDAALDDARAAWAAIVPPPGYEARVAATPAAARLTASETSTGC
jgi:hypothetical protein